MLAGRRAANGRWRGRRARPRRRATALSAGDLLEIAALARMSWRERGGSLAKAGLAPGAERRPAPRAPEGSRDGFVPAPASPATDRPSKGRSGPASPAPCRAPSGATPCASVPNRIGQQRLPEAARPRERASGTKREACRRRRRPLCVTRPERWKSGGASCRRRDRRRWARATAPARRRRIRAAAGGQPPWLGHSHRRQALDG